MNWECINQQLESGYQDVNEPRAGADQPEWARGATLLEWAVREKNPDAIKLLLRHGADIEGTFEAQSPSLDISRTQSPLMMAAILGCADCVKALVEGGADVEIEHYADPWWVDSEEESSDEDRPPREDVATNALACAAAAGSLHCVEVLLESGADPNSCQTRALFLAVQCGKPGVVAVLLKAGADVNIARPWPRERETPLCLAASWCSCYSSDMGRIRLMRTRVIPTLLRAGATVFPRNAARYPYGCNDDSIRQSWPRTASSRITLAQESATYLGNVLAAGGFKRYDIARRAPFVAMLERVNAFPIPKEVISIVCSFWLRVGDYQHDTLSSAFVVALATLRGTDDHTPTSSRER